MRALPRTARLVWAVVVGTGLLTLGAALALLPLTPFDHLTALVLILGGGAANFFVLQLPSAREHHRQESTVASAVYVAALLLLPPQVAILTTAAAYGLEWAVRPRMRPWYKNLFNICQYS